MFAMNKITICHFLRNAIAQLFIVAAMVLMGAPGAVWAADMKQTSFATPEQATEALVAANRTGNKAELLRILGPKAKQLISSGDRVADKKSRLTFVTAYDNAHRLESDGSDKQILIVGKREWPLPISLVRQDGTWRFDTEAGKQEILNRRIGRNEMNVIAVCRAYVVAQGEYAAQHPLADGKHEYAQRILSHEGKRDGLYWPVAAGEPESPLGPFVASAQAKGYKAKSHGVRRPYHGYYYRILTGQSEKVPGGAIDYISDSRMTGGFALLAFPAKYGDSGIMTFIVSQDGIVHEKDFGPDTAKRAAQITQYDPDESWKLP